MQVREAYEKLTRRFDRVARVRESATVLGWDRATVMPSEGIESRTGQLQALDRHARELLRDPEVEEWLARVDGDLECLGDWERANVREMRRMHAIRTAPPAGLAAEWSEARTECRSLWRRARPDDDFERLQPRLERVVALARDVAAAIGDALDLEPYDAMLERHSPGMRSDRVDELFGEFETGLPDLIDAARARQPAEEELEWPDRPIPPADQERAARRLMEAVGFDFDWGRLDTSAHGFCGGTRHDVRVTTRWDPDDFREGIYCALHETGHALYNRRQPADWYRQPVGQGTGKTIHESQSLLVERFACRTEAFCRFAAPIFAEEFGAAEVFEPENLHRLVTRVEPGPIRVEADEVTYPAHVLFRYDLEKRMLQGDLSVPDLPEAWDASMRERLGIEPPDDRDGCMQDMHWMDGIFGYFPTYLLGAMAAAQLFEATRDALPDLRKDLANGDFGGLMSWLQEHVHARGSLLEPDDLLEEATGAPLGATALRRHLEDRYAG